MSLLNLTGPVTSFGTDTLTVYRQGMRSYDANGRVIALAPTEVEIRASVQPADAKELKEPAGRYGSVGIVMFTRTELVITMDPNEADRVDYRGNRYELISLKDYGALGGYYRAVAQMVQTE